MKRNKMMIGTTVVGLLLAGVSVEAKFGVKIPKAPSGGGGGGDISGLKADLEKKTADVVKECAGARALYKESYAELCEALGLKEEAIKFRSEADALKSGNTSVSDLKKQKVISEGTKKAIDEKMDAVGEVTPEQQKHFWASIGLLTEGLSAETAQVEVAAKLGEMAKEITEKASGLDKAAAVAVAEPALDLAMLVPGDVKEVTSVLTKFTKYATTKNIKKPSKKDADNAI